MKNAEGRIQAINYPNSWGHISDELRRLDMLIRINILTRRGQQAEGPLDHLKGLVIGEEEIANLLSDGPPDVLSAQSAPEIQRLSNNLDSLESLIQQRCASSLKDGAYLALPALSGLFHLTRFEEQCLIICLANEIDRKYEKLYAYLQDDVTRKRPSVDLIFSLLRCTAEEKLSGRLAFDPRSPLMRYRLIEVDGSDASVPLISRYLKLDNRITDFLLGLGVIDSRIESAVQLSIPGGNNQQHVFHDALLGRMKDYINVRLSSVKTGKRNILFHLWGSPGSGRLSLIKTLCSRLQIPLLLAEMKKIGTLPLLPHEFAWLLGRESLLQQAGLCIDNFDLLRSGDNSAATNVPAVIETIMEFSTLTFIIGTAPLRQSGLTDRVNFIEIEFPIPGIGQRRAIWERSFTSNKDISAGVDAGELAGKFRFTNGQIQDVIAAAATLASWRSPGDTVITREDIHAAGRNMSNADIGPFAAKTVPKYMWDDIVLPQDMIAHLREICDMVKYRQLVFGQWGYDEKFSLGKGANALFSGPSGTGKTMAAEIIANELKLDMYKIDLSQVVSKYIGETERNLQRIFDEAHRSNSILFFDEADALFGKRSEVKDAHDRYANIEIAYLLQKMEGYEGIVIMATNLRGNMDSAFVRRMQFIVEFPFPDEHSREQIWRCSFPKSAPLSGGIDFLFLARQFKLSGGNITNASIGSACLAAADGMEITMSHLIRSVQREYQKM
ncbi:MAG TPA: AAA family ATPase, partial [Thermodesulfovibrionales bacterium]|nr:AAA family ATPase [Thermodesulfovibrionales bacterium]